MHYIIDPKWFYLIDVLSGISAFVGFVVFISCLSLMVFIIGFVMLCEDKRPSLYSNYETTDKEYDMAMQGYKEWKMSYTKNIIKCASVFIASVVIMCAIPSESACYKMMAASLLTEENIKIAENETENIIENIIEASIKLKNNQE